ncbi:SRPBCC family protein [Kitasatospora xanthocidica]|uniref:SRPBCC family protein n=1 Tax=Kitasatospora xanthocidica TaxID=83382 RepID=A0A372ZQQ8_9ACTN|nr:SRPBCC family protein [Kitasatospora xanthocidica]RGD58183.1 SRPBCC family protein [Kitasatospora xanthocidica]
MSMVKESVDVAVPLHAAYNQWTLAEEFPRFMEGVDSVSRLDSRHNHWQTSIDGITREFDTEIVDQEPEELIAWRGMDGEAERKEVVTFRRLDPGHTRVTLAVDLRPAGPGEKAADVRGEVDRRVKGDLRRFKEYVEERARGRGGAG